MRFLFAAMLVATLATPLAAQTFRAEGGITVTPVPGGFSVPDGGGMGARGMWCAAADYAIRRLGAVGIERLYVAQPYSGRRSPVVFTLDPADLEPSRVLIPGFTIRRAGANLSVGHAMSFCADFRIINP
ncbi:MAG: hypothetical protein HKN30_13520 [Sulfitobacter sp.]|nr:hypothetical protein [Sulfitobacter sp.]